jgi:hypothetical protein
MPAGPPVGWTTDYPWTWPEADPDPGDGEVDHLAANFLRCANINAEGLSPKIEFTGFQSYVKWTLGAFVLYADDTYYYERIEIDPDQQASRVLPIELTGISWIGILIGNSNLSGWNHTYEVTVSQVDSATPVEDATPRVFAVDGAFPNPFNPRTTVKFRLPEAGHTVMEILDVRGRVVDTVFRGQLEAGEHGLAWDGQDRNGRNVAAGTYFARVRTDGYMASTKMTLAK